MPAMAQYHELSAVNVPKYCIDHDGPSFSSDESLGVGSLAGTAAMHGSGPSTSPVCRSSRVAQGAQA
jgi:hypothetical protein